MGFSSEEVIAEVAHKLQISGKQKNAEGLQKNHSNSSKNSNGHATPVSGNDEQTDLMLRVVESLLARAPKQFLSTIDTTEFSEVVRSTTISLGKWLQEPQSLFIESFVGKDFYYVSVVMKDCPFIINTFNNILERLGLLEVVTLHPIVAIKGMSASVGVLVFSGIEQKAQKQLIEELYRILPLLSRACADFGTMTQAALRQSEICLESGRSLWALDIAELVNWFTNGGLVFLGAISADPKPDKDKADRKQDLYTFNSRLGILAFSSPELTQLQHEIEVDYSLFKPDEKLRLSKLTMISPVHYRRRLLHIAIRNPGTGSMQSFLGTLTSRAISEEAATMPLVRLKLDELVRKSEVALYGHDHKALVKLINATPKHHLLNSDVDSLAAEIKLVQDVDFLDHSLARLNIDEANRGVTTVVGLSSDNFYSEMKNELQAHLETRLSALSDSSDVYLTSLNDSVARFYFYTPLPAESSYILPSQDLLFQIAQELAEISLGWSGKFQLALDHQFGKKATNILQRYHSAFTGRYKALTSPSDALSDITLCERVSEANPIRVRYDPDSKFGATSEQMNPVACSLVGTVSIVKLGQQLTIGKTLPVLENMGFAVIDSETLELKLSAQVLEGLMKKSETIYLHRFFVKQGQIKLTDLSHFSEVVAPALENILSETTENDSLNSLLLSANLNSVAVNALRTYYNLLWQIRKTSSRLSIRGTLVHNPKSAALLWQLFQSRFDPSLELSIEKRIEKFDRIWLQFQDELKGIKDIIEDANLKSLAQLIICTVRTNFFSNPKHIALKIHSEKLPLLRGARPMYETFVYGPEVEGVHLRSSKVSRGGIRWSERREDYRTEVLGLMRVQRIKNAIVVPAGAKGGFVIRDNDRGQPLTREGVVAGYKEFIRALLSLADNLVDGKPVSPKNLVIYDEPDPYLVVAADKGTASFSDYANQIAVEEFDFWLNDGFASGGSQGYGHKDLGITARGAWECTKQHFMEIGINFDQDPFSVVGIGDMSGDVFGNGLLLNKNMQLLAAFDHRHVFIDPSPKIDVAFEERARLFALPRSSWADYKSELISEGGGIFNRLDKDIQLSQQARAALGISDSETGPFTGEQVISFALKAPVDLLWNGGIGTYVKGSTEVDSEVNDTANDAVRISASELRAKVVGEGGNVGFTQAARVEFSLKGGRINTDSIDNSAGVDLSDHEVNLKILFQKLQHDGLCSREQRDTLFKEMSSEVAASTLSHNRNQAFVISVAERASKKSLDYFRALIRELCDRSYLTRVIDGLPSDDELEKRSVRRVGMTRPEIAVCLAGMKLWIKDEIMRSGLAKDPALQQFSLHYFPTILQNRFKEQLLQHPLLENITAAELTNHLVDLVGITFLHRLQLTEGVEIEDALRATIAASLVIKAKDLLNEIEVLHTFEKQNDFLDARLDLGRAVRVMATHFIHRFGNKINISECELRYQSVVQELFASPEKGLPQGPVRNSFDRYREQRQKSGISVNLSQELSFLHISWLTLDASDLAKGHEISIVDAHRLLVFVWEQLKLEFLVLQNQTFGAKNKWEHELMMSSYDILRSSVAQIGAALLERNVLIKGEIDLDKVKEELEKSPSFNVIETTVAELKTTTPEVAVLHALARHLNNFRI